MVEEHIVLSLNQLHLPFTTTFHAHGKQFDECPFSALTTHVATPKMRLSRLGLFTSHNASHPNDHLCCHSQTELRTASLLEMHMSVLTHRRLTRVEKASTGFCEQRHTV
jgi:hypothetical protein